jgi:hypothetical protein
MSLADRPAALFAGVESLDVFAGLLAEIDTDTSCTVFYHRIREAICRPPRRDVHGQHHPSAGARGRRAPNVVRTAPGASAAGSRCRGRLAGAG